jgi:DNA-binding response OmpR family regulator
MGAASEGSCFEQTRGWPGKEGSKILVVACCTESRKALELSRGPGSPELRFCEESSLADRSFDPRISAVILDERGVDLDRALRVLRLREPRAPVICMGPDRGLDHESAVLERGATEYWATPFDIERLKLLLSAAGPLSRKDRSPVRLGPLAFIPGERLVVSDERPRRVAELDSTVLICLFENPGEWVSLSHLQSEAGLRLSESAAASRFKDVVRRLRRTLGRYAPWLRFNRRRGILLGGPR